MKTLAVVSDDQNVLDTIGKLVSYINPEVKIVTKEVTSLEQANEVLRDAERSQASENAANAPFQERYVNTSEVAAKPRGSRSGTKKRGSKSED